MRLHAVMPPLNPRDITPTDEEDAKILAAIEADPDTWILSDEEWEQVRPIAEVHPEIVAAYKNGAMRISRETLANMRGPKEEVTLSLDEGLLLYFTQTGEGWEQRLNDMLRGLVFNEREKLVACSGDVYSCACTQ